MGNVTIRKLTKDDIEVKVKQIFDGGALLLLYKTARVDMSILDEVYGPLNWTDDYKEIKGNLFCGIGVRTSEEKNFIWKWDCGIESREDDGNEKKGEASDSFKRAATKHGIGRELYTAPSIFINAETEQDGKFYRLKDKYAKFFVNKITYTERGDIDILIIVDRSNRQVFPKLKAKPDQSKINLTSFKPETETPKNEKPKTRQTQVLEALKTSDLKANDIADWIFNKTGKKQRVDELTEEVFAELLKSINSPAHQVGGENVGEDKG